MERRQRFPDLFLCSDYIIREMRDYWEDRHTLLNGIIFGHMTYFT